MIKCLGPNTCFFPYFFSFSFYSMSICIWNAHAVSLVLPAFDDTDSLGSSPCQVVYPRLNGSTLGDCLPFSCGEYGG